MTSNTARPSSSSDRKSGGSTKLRLMLWPADADPEEIVAWVKGNSEEPTLTPETPEERS